MYIIYIPIYSYIFLILSRYVERERGEREERERDRGGEQRDAARIRVREYEANTSESERRYELPKLPFDSSDKLCKQFDRWSYRFAVEL